MLTIIDLTSGIYCQRKAQQQQQRKKRDYFIKSRKQKYLRLDWKNRLKN